MDKLICAFWSSLKYLFYLKERAEHDRLTVNAGYMAYITLLSLVPLTTVIFSALARIPSFENVGDQVRSFIFRHFVPAAGEAVQTALEAFIANTAQMTTVGLAFLFITAILLISSIDKNLNYIWRVEKLRRWVYSFSIYWMVLTLGPILMGSSIAVSSHVSSLKLLNDDAVNLFYGNLPIILTGVSFFGLYLLVPNTKVKVRDAFWGAFIATILFEVCKFVFAYYIREFPSYHVIYGTLAAVPILFVWIYLCWFIVLIGAEITASLGERETWQCDDDRYLPEFLRKIKAWRIKSDSSDTTSE